MKVTKIFELFRKFYSIANSADIILKLHDNSGKSVKKIMIFNINPYAIVLWKYITIFAAGTPVRLFNERKRFSIKKKKTLFFSLRKIYILIYYTMTFLTKNYTSLAHLCQYYSTHLFKREIVEYRFVLYKMWLYLRI